MDIIQSVTFVNSWLNLPALDEWISGGSSISLFVMVLF